MSYTAAIQQWDTDFFQLNISRVDPKGLTNVEFVQLQTELRQNEIELAYIVVEDDDIGSLNTLQGLSPIDVKVTLSIDTSSSLFQPSSHISRYTGNVDPRLYELALIAGGFSRFKLDNNFPVGSFEALYRRWIEKETADEANTFVWVCHIGIEFAGFISVTIKDGTPSISLIATNKKQQVKGIGRALIHHSLHHLAQNGYSKCTVSTQEDNRGAMAFYKALGFNVIHKQYYYHLWL
ncbi:MAG: GNAT family N-acetyltransferase [Chitinophagales bacterium]